MTRIIAIATFVASLFAGGLMMTPTASASAILVAQCSSNTSAACQNSGTPIPFSDVVTGTQLGALGFGSTQSVVVAQTSCCVIRLGQITLDFTTLSGPVVDTIPEFSGNDHLGPCSPFCEVDTIGSVMIPEDALSLTISGTFGNSVVPNTSGLNLYLGGVPEPGAWAMMLIGIAAIGLGLRSRSSRATSLA